MKLLALGVAVSLARRPGVIAARRRHRHQNRQRVAGAAGGRRIRHDAGQSGNSTSREKRTAPTPVQGSRPKACPTSSAIFRNEGDGAGPRSSDTEPTTKN